MNMRLCAGVLWLVCLICCAGPLNRASADGSAPAAEETIVPEWANTQEDLIPDADAQNMRRACSRFWTLLTHGDRKTASEMLLPAGAKWFNAWMDTPPMRVVGFRDIQGPYRVSPDWAVIAVDLSLRDVVPSATPQEECASGIRLGIRTSKPRGAMTFDGSSDMDYMSLPVGATRLLPPPWASGKPDARNQPNPVLLAFVRSCYSQSSALWDADAEKLDENVRAWWAAQSEAFGKHVSLPEPERFVGMAGDGAVVERRLVFHSEEGATSKVAYRFLMVLEATGPFDPKEMPTHLKWRIADQCVYSVEKVSARSAAPGGAPSGASAPAVPPAAATR